MSRPTLHLVMFDIDGTLIRSNAVDARCFEAAFQTALGLDSINTDWASYRHVTDAGLAGEIIMSAHGRPASDQELSAVCSHHMSCLAAAGAAAFAPVPGAIEFIDYVRGCGDLALAVATGNWAPVARQKLVLAGFDLADAPLATSSDAIEREQIMALAAERAQSAYRCWDFSTITYFGDAVWDVRASERLGYSFVGVCDNRDAGPLRQIGATTLISDFTDSEQLRGLLRSEVGSSQLGGPAAIGQ